MKKLACLLLFLATTAGAQTVSVGAPAGRCGQSVTVPVSIDNVSGLLSVELRIAFDNAALTVANVAPGTLTSGFATSSNVVGGNSLRIAMASGSPVSGSGTIANVTFNVAAAASGTAALTISNVLVNDAPRNGTSGAVAIACTTACAALPAPQNVMARGEVPVGSAFDVTWSAVAGATAYVVEEFGASTTTVTTTSATFTKNGAGTFQYRVAARNACNVDGPYSAPVVVHVAARPPLPANARVLPVAGSADGSFGSSYRTSVQLYNACGVQMSGAIVFHAMGASGGDGDPALTYNLAPGETVSYPDLVAALGVPRGLGSLDIVPSGYQVVPLTVVRIFNDAGASGTTGMTLDALALGDALQAGQRGVVVAPIEPARARMNVGIRTLRDGATLTITVKDRRGATVAVQRQSYPPTFLTQFAATSIAPLAGDEVLLFEVESGSAIVYASTNDNVTQDPSVQIARPLALP